MADSRGIITKQLGVWTIHYRSNRLFNYSDVSKVYGYLQGKVLNGVKTISGMAVLEQTGSPAPLSSNGKPTDESTSRTEHSDGGARTEAKVSGSLSYLGQFVKEIYSLGPFLFYVEVLCEAWNVVDATATVYASNRLLESTSQCLRQETCSTTNIIKALLLQFGIALFHEFVIKLLRFRNTTLETRVAHHFRQKVMKDAMRLDLATSKDPMVQTKIGQFSYDFTYSYNVGWEAFRGLLSVFFGFLRIFSSVSVFVGYSRSSIIGYVAVFLLLRLLSMVSSRAPLFQSSYVYYCSNNFFRRMAGLDRLAFRESLKEDTLNGNMADYVFREYDESRKALGDTTIKPVWLQMDEYAPSLGALFLSMHQELPIILFAVLTLLNGPGITVSSLLMLQQMESVVTSTFQRLNYEFRTLQECLHEIHNMYALSKIENKITDGTTPYPSLQPQRKIAASTNGARLEFRNVTFRYPDTEKDALTNVSFTVEPGQLVVIVGVNGSGKSSTIKLLTRLYDPTEGRILIDDQPLPTYKLDDVRRATAILRQDHPVLPLSLRENVALGRPERKATEAELQEAFRQGGAFRFMKKLKAGTETILEPMTGATSNFSASGGDEDLREINDKIEQEIELSGGETQRLSASRMFMRLMSDNIKLLIADEPTSALDPEGEFELFSRLREHRGGKTVIFITHRFGHLTKHADLILCLKDGQLVEQGTHESLLALEGEYKKLHRVQEQAFI